jgi:hypothetical protein
MKHSDDVARAPSRSPRGLDAARRLAWILDDLVRIPGTKIRVGLDPLLGLLPGGGDAGTALVSTYTIVAAYRLGAPPEVIFRMGVNIAFDLLVGVVPVIGDLFDVGWKANRKNVALLERYVAAPQPVRRRSRVLVIAVLLMIAVLLAGVAAMGVLVVGALLRWFLPGSAG